MTLENYKNGKLEGLRSVYYPSGKIAEEISYLNNIKNGLYKSFREWNYT
jgi:antitoxin component YwqK of YwqJK toxin-antitoxin module